MDIEATKVITEKGYALPFVRTGGRWYLVETKPSLLAAGIASMIAATDDFKTDVARPSAFRAALPADPGDGRPHPATIPESTRDAAVVELARKFALSGAF